MRLSAPTIGAATGLGALLSSTTTNDWAAIAGIVGVLASIVYQHLEFRSTERKVAAEIAEAEAEKELHIAEKFAVERRSGEERRSGADRREGS